MNFTSHLVKPEHSTLETDKQDTFVQEAGTYIVFKVAKYIATSWFPVLIPLGLAGNILSFLVMIMPKNRKMSTCIYMAAISINDSILLCFDIHVWFVVAVNKRKWNEWKCKSNAYFAYLCLQTATYLILAMTIDKYIAIQWPHKSTWYSSPTRAKVIISIVIISVAMYNLPHFFITAVVTGNCYGYSAKGFLTKVYSWFTIIINAVIPFTMLIHMNYVIVKTVRNSRKIDERQKAMKSAENQLTTMLLLVTTLFLILLFPTYVRFIYAAFVSSDTPSKYAASIFIFEISYKLYVTNSGINFFLYCVSGQKLRNDLKEILCCTRKSSSSSMESRCDANTFSTIA